MPTNKPMDRLKYHVTGAIERGEKEAIKGIPDIALEAGMRLARLTFHNRGNHSEIHITEADLAALLSLAYQDGLDGRMRSVDGVI